VRVLVDDVADLLRRARPGARAVVPVPSEFDDYIARPKPNGYRSLHTAVIGPQGKTLEVQIRTREMHAQAELGVAAHWRYKEGSAAGGRRWTSASRGCASCWSRPPTPRRTATASPLQGMDANLAEDRVYALTPKGEVVDLPQGGTVLDFAYQVHTDGRASLPRGKGRRPDRAAEHPAAQERRARRDPHRQDRRAAARLAAGGHTASLPARVRATRCAPGSTSSTARATCRPGGRLLDRDLRRMGLLHADLQPVLGKFNAATVDELLVLVALGDVGPNQVGRALLELERAAQEAAAPAASTSTSIVPPKSHASAAKASTVTVQGVDNLLAQVARCCQPLPGEAIVGYLTRARGVSVHRPDCAAFLRLAGIQPARVLPVEWGAQRGGQQVAIRIEGIDRKWLLKDITTLVAQLGLHVASLHAEPVRGGHGQIRVQLQARVPDFGQLGLLLARLESLPGIESARRA
jgi:GTP pyrophosphokinase